MLWYKKRLLMEFRGLSYNGDARLGDSGRLIQQWPRPLVLYKMVNGCRYYRALESVSTASALSTALTIYPCQIRVHQRWQSKLQLLNLQLGRRSGGRPQRTVYPRRLPVNTVIHTTLAGIEPKTFRLLVRRATSSVTVTDSRVTNTRFW